MKQFRFTDLLARLAWHLGPMIIAAVGFMAIRYIDRSIPVIRDFKIINQKLTPNGVEIDGIMDKRRDCAFEALTAYANDTVPVHVRFLDRPNGIADVSRAVRAQLWGPWEIMSGDAKTIELYAQHRCHVFWSTSTLLIKFAVVKVPENGNKEQLEVDTN